MLIHSIVSMDVCCVSTCIYVVHIYGSYVDNGLLKWPMITFCFNGISCKLSWVYCIQTGTVTPATQYQPHSITPHSITPHSITPYSITPHSITPHRITLHNTYLKVLVLSGCSFAAHPMTSMLWRWEMKDHSQDC